MSPLAEGGIDHEPALRRGDEKPEDLLDHHRLVHDHSVILPPSFSAASLNFASFSVR